MHNPTHLHEDKKYRFVPKTYGRGITPISREGRVVTVLIVLVVLGGSQLILGPSDNPELTRVIGFFVYVGLVSMLSISLTKSRTKGDLRWRRGKKDMDWE